MLAPMFLLRWCIFSSGLACCKPGRLKADLVTVRIIISPRERLGNLSTYIYSPQNLNCTIKGLSCSIEHMEISLIWAITCKYAFYSINACCINVCFNIYKDIFDFTPFLN